MSSKSILVAIMAAAILFGLAAAGCNRNARSNTAMNVSRSGGRTSGVRPAEVLSASVYRPPARVQPAPQSAPVTLAQTRTPQPQYQPQSQPQYQYAPAAPVVVAAAPAQPARQQPRTRAMTQAEYFASAQAYAAYNAPAPQPARTVQYTPDLVMARANLPAQRAVYVPVAAVPVPAAVMRAPIPELEPPRYQRLPMNAPGRPAAEIMMSATQDALTPVASIAPEQADPRQGWVASPTTAMRGMR